MVTGKMTKPMDLVNTPILTVLNMRVIGSMISNTGKVRSIGQMAHNMKEIISMVKRTDMVLSYGQTNLLTKVTLSTITFTGMELINGPTTESTPVIGIITRCTEQEYLLGLMDENMMGSTTTIRSKVTECSLGQIIDNTTDTG